MPELPEVETIRKQLENELIGDSLGEVKVLERMVFLGDEKSLRGEKIKQIGRQGKYLFVHFESGRGLGIHLKMTGRLVLDTNEPDTKHEMDYQIAEHTRVVVPLKSGRKIYYWDTRKFGYIKVVDDIKKVEEEVKNKLGQEPWQIDEITLLRKFQKTGRTIKDVLLDQSIIAGVGNIYANDALWLAGISPLRKAKTIGLTEVKKLLTSIRKVMERSLEVGGASDNTYRNFYGKKGSYQNEFLVYGKTKGHCPKCGKELIYTKIGGRGTWYCEQDQK